MSARLPIPIPAHSHGSHGSHGSYGSHASSRKTARFADSPPTNSSGSLGSHSGHSHSDHSHRSSRSRASAPKPAQYHESFSTSKRDHFHPPATYTVATPNAKYYVTLPPRPSTGTRGPARSESMHVSQRDRERHGEHRSGRHRSASQSQSQAQYRVSNTIQTTTGGATRYRPSEDYTARRTRSGVVVVSTAKVSFAERVRRLFGLGPPKDSAPKPSKTRPSSTKVAAPPARSVSTSVRRKPAPPRPSSSDRTLPLSRRGTR
ncbi:hypothetical protein BOTBODRAFT_47278 [Botryobasidium botryosum FD-172 SS1]|uniref:Uncharacterized protein n=1 Tax=Botryobasidium botryosum (strain FD-172 SS1) TaxID=930990 RepID=A0A067M332_BOTB1|nr:hypothetical protein BOTBODRAFT_47278 [Botryobasidium botryosum FD-172 SS1]